MPTKCQFVGAAAGTVVMPARAPMGLPTLPDADCARGCTTEGCFGLANLAASSCMLALQGAVGPQTVLVEAAQLEAASDRPRLGVNFRLLDL